MGGSSGSCRRTGQEYMVGMKIGVGGECVDGVLGWRVVVGIELRGGGDFVGGGGVRIV